MGETKIIYHMDEQETPYLVKLPLPADSVTLADFKLVLNKPNYKFFFKSMDQDFGVCGAGVVLADRAASRKFRWELLSGIFVVES
ncbi:hypothetical protein scyTo_0006304 [Scyliorhinus torazame]|uniref:DIX domain-containing protein n=1 Tax=Scyliorhinus torazame TaxID=75743 RepID=A0A401PH71_SCYTO|nr:hypothetical protein [Scyliorhinus torazame]